MTPALCGLPFRKLDVVCDEGMRWEAAAAGAVFSQLCIWQLWLDSVQRLKRYCHLGLLTWSIFYRVHYLFTEWDRMDRNALITKKYDEPLQGSHGAQFQLPACFQHWLPHCTVTCLVHLHLVQVVNALCLVTHSPLEFHTQLNYVGLQKSYVLSIWFYQWAIWFSLESCTHLRRAIVNSFPSIRKHS